MALDRQDQTLMKDAFYDALDKWHSKNKGGGAAKDIQEAEKRVAAGTTILGKAATEAGGVIKGLAGGALDLGVKMTKGGLTVTEASKTIGDSLKSAGGAGATLATSLGKTVNAFGDLINYVEEGLDTFRDISKTGVTFNNSVIDMQAAAAGSRLTLREFGNLIKDNNTNFLALGGSAGKGAKEFARLSKGFFDSGFGDKLTQLGYTTEELNSLMAIQMSNMTARELKAKGGDAAQFEATVRLAEEMDAMAKLTGKSRKEQEAALKEGQADGQRMSALQALKNKNIVGAQDAFNAVTTNTVGQFQTLMQDMVTAGRPLTKEMASYYGLLSKETKAAIAEAQEAVTRGDVKAAEEASKRAMALEAKETVTNNARINLGIQGNAIQKKAMEDQQRLGNLIIEKEKELKDKGFTGSSSEIIDAARKQLAAEIKEEQNARSGETASIIEAQNRIKDMGSAIQESIIVPLKDEANKRALNDFYKTIANLNQSAAKGGTAGSDKGFAGDVGKTVEPAIKGIKDAIARLVDEKGPEQKFSSDAAKASNQAQFDELKKAVEGTSRQQVAGEDNDIRALAKSLKAVDGEAVSKQLEKIAKDQGKSSADVLKEAVNKPGGVGNLSKSLAQDPAAKKVLDDAAAADKKEQSIKELTNKSASKGRDITDTSGEAITKGASAIGSALSSLTTKSIDLFKVEGDVRINTPSLPSAAESGAASTQPPKRNEGSLAAVGKIFENWGSGTMVELHGMESVMRPEDLEKIVESSLSAVKKSMSENKSMNPSGMFTELKAAMSGGGRGLNLNEISKNISTTISSSIAGGSSTTGKMTQTEDSKSAESEIDQLRTKFFEDWAKRKEVIIEEMSAEDRKFSKVQAAMKADETAMKIKEDYEKKKAELQQKIDDGIKWEISTKEAAVEETEKILSKELLILKAQGLEKLAITKFNEEEITKMLEKSGEHLNNFYIDMNGDLKSWAEETTASFGQGMSDAEAMMAAQGKSVDKPVQGMSDAEAMMAAQGKSVDKPVVGGMTFESMFNPIRTSAQSMMEKFGKENEQKKADEAKAAADKSTAKPEIAEKKTDSKPTPAASKADSTLNDVVNSLNKLNMMMGQLVSQHEDLGKKQLRASKANSVQP